MTHLSASTRPVDPAAEALRAAGWDCAPATPHRGSKGFRVGQRTFYHHAALTLRHGHPDRWEAVVTFGPLQIGDGLATTPEEALYAAEKQGKAIHGAARGNL